MKVTLNLSRQRGRQVGDSTWYSGEQKKGRKPSEEGGKESSSPSSRKKINNYKRLKCCLLGHCFYYTEFSIVYSFSVSSNCFLFIFIRFFFCLSFVYIFLPSFPPELFWFSSSLTCFGCTLFCEQRIIFSVFSCSFSAFSLFLWSLSQAS